MWGAGMADYEGAVQADDLESFRVAVDEKQPKLNHLQPHPHKKQQQAMEAPREVKQKQQQQQQQQQKYIDYEQTLFEALVNEGAHMRVSQIEVRRENRQTHKANTFFSITNTRTSK